MPAVTVEPSGLSSLATQPHIRPFILAEGDNLSALRAGVGGKSLKMGVVAIKDRGAARLDPMENLGLGVGDVFLGVEEAEMDRGQPW